MALLTSLNVVLLPGVIAGKISIDKTLILVRLALNLSTELDLHLESVDVKTAFLYLPLKPDEVIYMRRPAGLTDEDMPEIVQLTHCIFFP